MIRTVIFSSRNNNYDEVSKKLDLFILQANMTREQIITIEHNTTGIDEIGADYVKLRVKLESERSKVASEE